MDNSNLKEYCKDNISSMVIENKYYAKSTPDTNNLENWEIVNIGLEKYMVCSQSEVVK